MDLLNSPSELQCWDLILKGTRDMQQGTELSGIRVKAGGRDSLLSDRSADRGYCFLVSPPPTDLAGGLHI